MDDHDRPPAFTGGRSSLPPGFLHMKQVGILGLTASGKTTIFEILTQGAGVAPHGPPGRDHVGVVRVPDERIDRLSALYQPKKTTWSQIQFVESGAAGQSARAAGK